MSARTKKTAQQIVGLGTFQMVGPAQGMRQGGYNAATSLDRSWAIAFWTPTGNGAWVFWTAATGERRDLIPLTRAEVCHIADLSDPVATVRLYRKNIGGGWTPGLPLKAGQAKTNVCDDGPNLHVGMGDSGLMYPDTYRVQAWDHGVVHTDEVMGTQMKALVVVTQLLQNWPWTMSFPGASSSGNANATVRVTDGAGKLLGQWVISNGRWCHQGGAWTAGMPDCAQFNWQPSYPAAHPRPYAYAVRR